MKILTGRCLCEAISYEMSGELGPIYNCHCSEQKNTVAEICKIYDISRPSFYNYLKNHLKHKESILRQIL